MAHDADQFPSAVGPAEIPDGLAEANVPEGGGPRGGVRDRPIAPAPMWSSAPAPPRRTRPHRPRRADPRPRTVVPGGKGPVRSAECGLARAVPVDVNQDRKSVV